MKKLLSIALALVFAGSTVGFAAASGTATTPEKKTEKMDKADKGDMKAKKPSSKSASGTVKSATADSLVVAGKEKGKETEWTFAVDAKTKVKKGGKDATAADVKAGDVVQVRYMDEGGKAVAQSVMAREPKAAAAKSGDKAAAGDKAPAPDKAKAPATTEKK